jgi:N-acetyl-gamma-glutamyl-phosphate reductase/acetylglutamate kinase
MSSATTICFYPITNLSRAIVMTFTYFFLFSSRFSLSSIENPPFFSHYYDNRSELYSPPSPATPLISNPGCFATNTQLLLAPLLPHLSLTESPTIFGISGYSGAGTKKGSEPKINPEELKGGIKVYSLTDHIHEREAGYRLGSFPLNSPSSSSSSSSSSVVLNSTRTKPFQVNFIPSVAPWFQGIISTLSAPLEKPMRAVDIRELYEEMYRGKKLIQVEKEVPMVDQIMGKHGVRMGGFQVHSSGKRVVVVVSFLFSFLFFF